MLVFFFFFCLLLRVLFFCLLLRSTSCPLLFPFCRISPLHFLGELLRLSYTEPIESPHQILTYGLLMHNPHFCSLAPLTGFSKSHPRAHSVEKISVRLPRHQEDYYYRHQTPRERKNKNKNMRDQEGHLEYLLLPAIHVSMACT